MTIQERITELQLLLDADDVVVIVDEEMQGCIANKLEVTEAIAFYTDLTNEFAYVTDAADPDELEEFRRDNPTLTEKPVILIWGECE